MGRFLNIVGTIALILLAGCEGDSSKPKPVLGGGGEFNAGGNCARLARIVPLHSIKVYGSPECGYLGTNVTFHESEEVFHVINSRKEFEIRANPFVHANIKYYDLLNQASFEAELNKPGTSNVEIEGWGLVGGYGFDEKFVGLQIENRWFSILKSQSATFTFCYDGQYVTFEAMGTYVGNNMGQCPFQVTVQGRGVLYFQEN